MCGIKRNWFWVKHINDVNSLNAKLNPICHLLALLGAHPILHISRIRVKYKQDKPLWNEKIIGRYGCSYKRRNKSGTDNKQIVAK